MLAASAATSTTEKSASNTSSPVNETLAVLSVRQVATEVQVDEKTVRRWIHSGDLEALVLPGGHFRIPVKALQRLPRFTPTKEPAHG